MQRYLFVPPDGTPIVSQLVSVILTPFGTFDLRSSSVADFSKPTPVTDPEFAGDPRARTDRQVSAPNKTFIIEFIAVCNLATL